MDEVRIRSLLDEAAERYNEGDYDKAIALWRAALDLDPDNQKAREGIRMASLLAADWEQAGAESAASNETLTVDDSTSRERVEAGIARVKELANRGQYAEALEGCELLAEIAPGLEEVRQLADHVRRAAGTTDSVPVRGGMGALESHLQSARQALEQGRNREAARAARAALQLDPSNMEACGILSLAADEAEAAEPVRIGESHAGAPVRAAGATPESRVSALIQEGQTAFDQHSFQDAIAIWSRVFAIDQANPTAGALIDRARAAIDDQARQLDDLFYRGVDAKEAGRLQEALGLFEEVLAASPSNAEARAQISEIEARLRPSAQTIAIDSAAARDVAQERSRANKTVGEPQLFSGSIPLARPAPSPRASARREEMAAVGRSHERAGGGSRRVMVGLGLMVILGAGAGAYLWLGRDTGTMPEALATEAAPVRPPAPPAGAGEASTPAQPPGQLQVLPGGQPAPPPAPPQQAPVEAAGSAPALEREGREHFQAERWAEAALALRKAFELDPVQFASQDLLEQAMSHLERQAHLEREMGQANQYFKEEDYASALHKFYRLHQDYPEMAGVGRYIENSWYNWGVLLLQSGAVDEAAEKFDEVLEIDPADRDAARAREVARKYHGRRRDTVYDSYAATLTPRAIDER